MISHKCSLTVSVHSTEMKAVTVVIIIVLVDQGLCESITLSSCDRQWTMNWTWTEDPRMYELELCTLSDSRYTFDHPIKFINPPSSNAWDISHTLEAFNSTCSQHATSASTSSILIALLAFLVVLLAIVSTGWVCTCWAMKKRRQKMNINTGNIR